MSKTTAKYQIEKVCLTVDRLYKASPSLEYSDKIAEIDKTIEVIKEAKKLVPYPKSKRFPVLLKYLEDAKLALESNDTCECEKLIQAAFGTKVDIAKENNISPCAYVIET